MASGSGTRARGRRRTRRNRWQAGRGSKWAEFAQMCQAKMDRSDTNFFAYFTILAAGHTAIFFAARDLLTVSGLPVDLKTALLIGIPGILVSGFCSIGLLKNGQAYRKAVFLGTKTEPPFRWYFEMFNSQDSSDTPQTWNSAYRLGFGVTTFLAGSWAGLIVVSAFTQVAGVPTDQLAVIGSILVSGAIGAGVVDYLEPGPGIDGDYDSEEE